MLNLLERGLAILVDGACELQCFACQRIVKVHGHIAVGHLDDCAVELVAFAVHQRHFGAGEDVFVVEFAIDLERLARHGAHEVLVALAEGLGSLQGEIELVASGELA